MTPITKQSLEELKKKARAATKNVTVVHKTKFYATLWDEQESRIATMDGQNQPNNADYYAATSPDVILDLITRVEGMNLALQRITWQMNQSKTFKEYAEEHQDAAKSALESFGVK